MSYGVSTAPEARRKRLADTRIQNLFRLYNERRLTHAQIAAMTGLSVRTVQQRIVQHVRDLRAEALDTRDAVS